MINITPRFNVAIQYGEGFVHISFARPPDGEMVEALNGLNQQPSFRIMQAQLYEFMPDGRAVASPMNENRLEWHIGFSLAYDCKEVALAIVQCFEREHGLSCRLIEPDSEVFDPEAMVGVT